MIDVSVKLLLALRISMCISISYYGRSGFSIWVSNKRIEWSCSAGVLSHDELREGNHPL